MSTENLSMEPYRSVVLENVMPELDCGRYPVKRECGDQLDVEVDAFKDGHDILVVCLLHRKKGQKKWIQTPMDSIGNDRWRGSFWMDEIGRYEYTIRAYGDMYLSWADEIVKKLNAEQDIASELLEGTRLIKEAKSRAPKSAATAFNELLRRISDATDQSEAVAAATSVEAVTLMTKYPDPTWFCMYDKVLEVVVDRVEARYAAWYEFFPRSAGTTTERSATFKECEQRLPDIAAMGFNVVYFPPIHPIGKTARKGRNNSVTAEPGEPGSPYAIGSDEGGHKAVEPGLGTLEDFTRLIAKCRSHGLEVALDFAINCSPDHPYVKEHPEWFYKRPDGSIKYAENPPKKYQDIYPVNFQCEQWPELWQEMRSIIEFWVDKGVHIFRVDNPHTKPVAFWEWLIAKVQEKYPRVIFLAEAFTRPKMMRALAKAGFTQSYTYFTWRNSKHEIIEYFTELTQGPMKEYFRGNLFPNTPDILPQILQEGGRAAFQLRAILATTLSSVYGIYSGFELCEGTGIPGTEEYYNSEKYEIKVWDWDRPGNIKDLITRLNRVRRENPALQEYDNLVFFPSDNANILFYGKATPDHSNVVLVVVNMDPFQKHHSFIHFPAEQFGINPGEVYQVHDLLTDQRYLWQGDTNYVELDPAVTVGHVFRVRRWIKRENDFDYFDM